MGQCALGTSNLPSDYVEASLRTEPVKPVKRFSPDMTHRRNDAFGWHAGIDHKVRKAFKSMAANFIRSLIRLEQRGIARCPADGIERTLQLREKIVPKSATSVFVPDRGFGRFQFSFGQNGELHERALRARCSISRSRIRSSAASASMATVSPRAYAATRRSISAVHSAASSDVPNPPAVRLSSRIFAKYTRSAGGKAKACAAICSKVLITLFSRRAGKLSSSIRAHRCRSVALSLYAAHCGPLRKETDP